jgi:glycosyltransferase involved in cell wall biosynthesis
MAKPSVSIVIPTQRRPGPLARAVRSAFQQGAGTAAVCELIVVDNDEVPSARQQVEELTADAPFPVRYIHEPRPGVAHARNAAMASVAGAFVAFLDDDEEAQPGWIAALLAVQSACAADVVFGPVRTRLPDSVTDHRDYLEAFFARTDPAPAGPIDHYYGCGDSLVRLGALPDPKQPFSDVRNHSGGEDDLLFSEMLARGARFAWAPDAWVWEHPEPQRLSLKYTVRRAFAYGQGASVHCATATPPDRLGVAGWMIQGIAQAGIFGLLALLQWLIRAPRRAFALDRAARGLGKTLWWSPFKIDFYGLAAST